MNTKKCMNCGEDKSVTEFNINRSAKDGLDWRCKECKREYDRHRAYGDEYPTNRNLYDAMFEEQNGKCAICGGPPTHRKRLGIDHNHHTGKIRGLLCTACNMILGYVDDDGVLLQKMIDYLKREQP